MTIVDDHTSPRPPEAPRSRLGWLAVAGVASLGAGAVHAAAVGIHAEHRAAAVTFAVIAAVQLLWGGLALVRPGRAVAVAGSLIGIGAVVGWALAKTVGIGFVSGLERPEALQAADGIAAALAAASAALALVALTATRSGRTGVGQGWSLAGATGGVAAVALFAMVSGAAHVHAHGGADPAELGADTGQDHAAEVVSSATPAVNDDHPADNSGTDHAEAGHDASAMAPVPYDPAKPIDLGGVEGVTPEQQAMAENIVAVTVMRLGQWADPAAAEAAGFRSIGDGFTGHEHFVNPEFRNDDTYLDPDRPESLVYDTSSGERRLVAAMYMVDEGTPLADVPDYGGDLMQWHTHENLCYNAEGQVRGLTDAEGNCAPGLVQPVPTPMIHVWIEPNECGPFAALEGVAGGRIPDGETRLCDDAHGA